MAYRNSVPKLIVGRGESVLLENGPATVIDLYSETKSGQTSVVVEYYNGDQQALDLSDYLQAAELELFDDNPLPPLTDDLQWERLPEETKRAINQRMRDLTLVETGDADGDLFTNQARPGHVDPRYDPAKYTLEERRQRMSSDIAARPTKELRGSSPDTLRRQASQVRSQGGRNALIHGRTGLRSQRSITPELRQVVDRYVADELQQSQRSIGAHVALLRVELRRAGVEVESITEWRLKQLYLDATQGKGFHQGTAARRGKAGRLHPSRSRGWELQVPFSFIEVDSTPIDQILVDQYGRILTSPHLLVAECAATRKVVGLRLTASRYPYDAREVKGLLWDTIRGRIARQSVLRATCLPDNVVFAPFQDAEQPSRADSINMDRGPQYNSTAFLRSLSRMGINARINDPGRGVQKPHVEAILRTLTAFGQKLPGYTGSGVHLRGRNIEKGPLLQADAFVLLLWEMIDSVYHVRPHSRLFHPDHPNHRFSPNEFMTLLLNSGGRLTGEVDLRKALQLLELRESSLQHKGLEIDRRWYTSDAIKELMKDGLGDRDRPGLKLKVYVDDRHPEYVLVQLPGGQIELATQEGGDGLAPLADLLDRDIRSHVLSGAPRSEARKAAREAEDQILTNAWNAAKTAEQFRKETQAQTTEGPRRSSTRRKLAAAPELPDEAEQKAKLADALRQIRSVP